MTDLDRFDALSFDCYGTLIDWETGLAAELEPWARRAGVDASTEELLAAFAAVETDVQGIVPAPLYPDVLAQSLTRVGQCFGAPVTDDDRRSFGSSVARWPTFPDSAPALARLSGRFRLVVLSNIDRASFAASNERLGVTFDLVVTAEDVGSYKPRPAHFEAMFGRLAEIGAERGTVLHVAQSLFHDHDPARALGLASAWIDRRHEKDGFGATPPPATGELPRWRFPTMAAFADAAGV